MDKATFRGFVPYLFYDDVEAALDWYARTFGFEERGRWTDDAGRVTNAEMNVGDTELWLDGGGRQWFDAQANPARMWVGIWVADVDRFYLRLKDNGVEPSPPVDREFGVRTFAVDDPFGYSWGFLQRLG